MHFSAFYRPRFISISLERIELGKKRSQELSRWFWAPRKKAIFSGSRLKKGKKWSKAKLSLAFGGNDPGRVPRTDCENFWPVLLSISAEMVIKKDEKLSDLLGQIKWVKKNSLDFKQSLTENSMRMNKVIFFIEVFFLLVSPLRFILFCPWVKVLCAKNADKSEESVIDR